MASADQQLAHQVRFVERRLASFPWLNWIFALGFLFSALGLAVAVARFREEGSPYLRVAFLGLFAAFFGAGVVRWLIGYRPRPRVVPYFPQKLEEYGAGTTAAFRRGRALYLELAALDGLAASAGVRPLSDFGFAYDHFEQEVVWHRATEGVSTVEALSQRLNGASLATAGVVEDLAALATVLRVAAERGSAFSLVLRLDQTDSLQALSWEQRKGSFW